jgi:hypothetical protein
VVPWLSWNGMGCEGIVVEEWMWRGGWRGRLEIDVV